MNVLVTGANGFVGTALQGRLRHEGYNIKAITRKEVGDIDSRTEWALHLENVETIVHLAGRAHVMQETESDPLAEFRKTNRDGTACLAQCAIASGVRRIVFISSVKVNGEASNDPFNSSSPAMPQDPYAISKFEAEQALETLRSELEIVIFRPPLVYGPNVRGNFIRLIKLVDRGLPLPLASVENLRSLVGLTNLTDAICWGIRAQPGLYFPSDRQDQSTADLIRKIADALNRPARLFPMHPLLLKVAGNLTGKREIINRLTGSLTVDGDLPGWSPPDQWMQKSNVRSTGINISRTHHQRQACYNRGFGFTPLSPPWPSIMKSTMNPLPNLNRARIAFAHDTVMAAISFPLSMFLRLGDFYYFYLGEYVLATSLAFAAISAPIFLYSRMYRGIWAYASIEDLAVITRV